MFCKGCHYNLRGQQLARCPECALEFDPNDASTFITPGVNRNHILLSVTLVYSALNLVFMGLAARGKFGPIPWSVFELLIVTCVVGALSCIVLLALRKRFQVALVAALGAAAVFVFLAIFNFLCMGAAVAAV